MSCLPGAQLSKAPLTSGMEVSLLSRAPLSPPFAPLGFSWEVWNILAVVR